MKFNKITNLLLLTSGLFAVGAFASPASSSSLDTQKEIKLFHDKVAGLSTNALEVGIEAYSKARKKGLDERQLLTIVDFTRPSTSRRLWVLDLNKGEVLFNDYVAHGKNSGVNYATKFSDKLGSLKSSLGVFLTKSTYQGKHGYSLRLKGLDKGFNDQASARAIVFHRASYVTQKFAQVHGYLGRSWGCFAVNPAIADSLVNTIKNGTIVVAYYPDKSWLKKYQLLS